MTFNADQGKGRTVVLGLWAMLMMTWEVEGIVDIRFLQPGRDSLGGLPRSQLEGCANDGQGVACFAPGDGDLFPERAEA